LKFCPACGTRLTYNSRSGRSLSCPKCGYESKLPKGDFLRGKPSVVKPFSSSIAVLDRNALNLRTFPIVSTYCPKCGGNDAETWNITVRSQNISSITFCRCVSCGYA